MKELCDAPAARRNRGPILEALRRLLPARGRVLEVASGTGQHAAFFARSLPGIAWQPSERDEALLGSIAGWAREEGVPEPLPPLHLDACSEDWPEGPFDAVFSANLVHIAPWRTCCGLLRGAGRCLRPGGLLILYGPFRVGGSHTAPSNQAFDASLRARNPDWGVRDLDELEAEAARHGLVGTERMAMPANNQVVVLRRQPEGGAGEGAEGPHQ